MKYIYLEEVDSTSSYLKREFNVLDDLTFVSAGYQSAGKGRLGRTWTSKNSSNLLFSLLIKNPEFISHYKDLSIVSAYTILEILLSYGIKDVSIKWPNDVYVNDSKICGILLESISTSDHIDALVIGIGLNVNQQEFEGDYLRTPTSMINELNSQINLNELRVKVFEKLIQNLNSIIEGKNFYLEITKFDYLKNKDAYSIIEDKEQLIHINGINQDYSLNINLGDKNMNIESGEISFHIK